MKDTTVPSVAAAVRDACLQAALAAWEDAGMSGLCAEGRWERAIDALRSLDLEQAVASAATGGPEENLAPAVGP